MSDNIYIYIYLIFPFLQQASTSNSLKGLMIQHVGCIWLKKKKN